MRPDCSKLFRLAHDAPVAAFQLLTSDCRPLYQKDTPVLSIESFRYTSILLNTTACQTY